MAPDDFDQALDVLEDVGLIARNPETSFYELHPLVRNVVWIRMTKATQDEVLQAIDREFRAIPAPTKVRSLSELQPAIVCLNALVRLKRWDEAYDLYKSRLQPSRRTILGDSQLVLSMLLPFLNGGDDPWPRLTRRLDRADYLLELGLAYEDNGDYEEAYVFIRKHNGLCPEPVCAGHFADLPPRGGA